MTGGGNGEAVVIDAGDGRSRSPLAAVRALAAGGYRVVVATGASRSLAASSSGCAERVQLPPDDHPDLAAAVRALRDDRAPLEVFPCSDATSAALRPELGVLLDKRTLSERARRAGLPVPEAITCTTAEEVGAAAGALGLPVIVKPAMSLRPAVLVEHQRDLAEIEVGPEAPCIVQERLVGPLTALAGVAVDGEMVAAVQQVALRTWPVDAGVSCAAVSIPVDEALAASVGRLMADLDGLIEVQLLEGRLIDANPRAYGSLPLAVAAGANLPALWCDIVAGRRPPQIRARPGVRYRWLDADIRAVATLRRRGRIGSRAALAALRPRSGTAHSICAAGDPRPVLTRALHVLGGAP